MKRPHLIISGYTLIEILVATTLSLILLGGIIAMFGKVGDSITDSRSILESADQLRMAEARLQLDLAGITVTMNPPRDPAKNEGYFEYIEGPVGAATMTNSTLGITIPLNPAVNTNLLNPSAANPNLDTSASDFDDILMFTTRTTTRPFVGKVDGKRAPLAGETPDGNDPSGDYMEVTSVQSDVAEVAWFLRGRTLHRRVLLVCPQFVADTRPISQVPVYSLGYYSDYDISARQNGAGVIANSLGDLTRRECRFAHPTNAYPHDARLWYYTCPLPPGFMPPPTVIPTYPTLPTLRESSSSQWIAGGTLPPTLPATQPPALPALDFWTNNPSYRVADNAMIAAMAPPLPDDSTRISDDVILTNVIGFDVKVWDTKAPVLQKVDTSKMPPVVSVVLPGDSDYEPAVTEVLLSGTYTLGGIYTYTLASRGAYVDLGYDDPLNAVHFSRLGQAALAAADNYQPRVYDTFSNSHFSDQGSNGIDDDSMNGVDDDDEKGTNNLPPYWYPLRGIQVKIRIFEPDSKQIREVTVKQDFIP